MFNSQAVLFFDGPQESGAIHPICYRFVIFFVHVHCMTMTTKGMKESELVPVLDQVLWTHRRWQELIIAVLRVVTLEIPTGKCTYGRCL
jgi:hypothetical protein